MEWLEEGCSSAAGVPSNDVATLDSPSLSFSESGTCNFDDAEEDAGGAPKENALGFDVIRKDVASAHLFECVPNINPTGLPAPLAPPNPPNIDGFPLLFPLPNNVPVPVPAAADGPLEEPKLKPDGVEEVVDVALFDVPNGDGVTLLKKLGPLDDELLGFASSSFDASGFPKRLLEKTEGADDDDEPNMTDDVVPPVCYHLMCSQTKMETEPPLSRRQAYQMRRPTSSEQAAAYCPEDLLWRSQS